MGKHVKITSESTRVPILTDATVTEIKNESPSVLGFNLQIHNPKFSFFAGQWYDNSMFLNNIILDFGKKRVKKRIKLYEKYYHSLHYLVKPCFLFIP